MFDTEIYSFFNPSFVRFSHIFIAIFICFISNTASSFTAVTNHINNHELWGFGSAFKTNLIAAGTNRGPVMIKETESGYDWHKGPGADQGNTDLNPLYDRYIYNQGYSVVQTSCKVIHLAAAGISWSNLTQGVLTNSPITKIIFQRVSDKSVYVGNKSGVFYRNNSMPNWELLGSGLPMCDVHFMFINYNEHKLKIGRSREAFEHGLFEYSAPMALKA